MKLGDKEPTDTELCRQVQIGKTALSQLIERHGGLARKWANKYSRQEQCCTTEDLFQECRRGLIDAANHFDPKRGAFSTCATLWMKKRALAFIDRAKQFGAQSDNLNEVPEEDSNKDYSFLLPHFNQVMRLYRAGRISLLDKEVMLAICSPQEQQEEILKPVWAVWWRQAKRRALKRVALQMKTYRRGRRGKIMRNLEIQQEMWA